MLIVLLGALSFAPVSAVACRFNEACFKQLFQTHGIGIPIPCGRQFEQSSSPEGASGERSEHRVTSSDAAESAHAKVRDSFPTPKRTNLPDLPLTVGCAPARHLLATSLTTSETAPEHAHGGRECAVPVAVAQAAAPLSRALKGPTISSKREHVHQDKAQAGPLPMHSAAARPSRAEKSRHWPPADQQHYSRRSASPLGEYSEPIGVRSYCFIHGRRVAAPTTLCFGGLEERCALATRARTRASAA